ncbi:hypothetical protein [Ferroacidibacillus organovorans]|uniref:hypothetical protein n=1 Tax=Ferroacidibacillus organovorans TaxID=1765683 RepID=UPI00128F0641|nr:hypothetical protein [Ferroacidibacillus organovorans]
MGNVIYALAGGIFQLIIGICMLAVGTTLFFTTYRTMVQKFSPIRLQGRISGVVSVLPKGLGLISVAMSSLLISVLHIKQVILIGALITVIAIPFALLSSLHSNIADASVDSCE